MRPGFERSSIELTLRAANFNASNVLQNHCIARKYAVTIHLPLQVTTLQGRSRGVALRCVAAPQMKKRTEYSVHYRQ
jgi:hypothetical protein